MLFITLIVIFVFAFFSTFTINNYYLRSSISLFVSLAVCFVIYWIPKKSILVLNYYYPQVITNIPKIDGVKRIAITIDDAPYGKSFKKILDVLRKHNAKASFFVISDYVKRYNFNNSLIDAINDGHELCNHGKTNTIHAIKSNGILRKELYECNKTLTQLYSSCNKTYTPAFYRPGCGFFTSKMIRTVNDIYSKVVIGSVYPHDPEIRNSTLNFWYIKKHIADGDILILHDREWTVQTLELLLPWLKENDYECVTLSVAFS